MTRNEKWDLVVPHRSRLIAVARHEGLSREDAEDVASDVLCRAVEHDFDEAHVEGLLVRAARRQAWRVLLVQRRGIAIAARSLGDERLFADVEDAVCEQDHARWLLRLLDDMAQRERAVFLLRADGRTSAEIMRETGLSYRSVERAITKARARLRRAALLPGLAALLWRGRRSSSATAMSVTAVAWVTIAALVFVAPTDRPSESPPARDVSPAAAPAVARRPAPEITRAPRRVPDRPREPADVTRRRSSVRARPLPTPSAPSVDLGPLNVYEPDEPIAERVRKCVENGVDVEVEIGGTIGVTCRDS